MYVSAKDSVDGNIIEFNILYAKDKSYEEIGRLYKSLEHYWSKFIMVLFEPC